MSALSTHRASLHCVLGEVQEKKCTGGFHPLSCRGTRMNPPSWLPKTAAHVTQRGFSEEPSLQRLLFAFPLSAAASHLDARQKRRKKKTPSLLLLNNLSIKTKPERQPRAGRLFCLMLNIPRPGQHAPECRERVQGPSVGSVVGAGLVRKGPARPPAPGPAQPRDGGRWGKTSAAPLCTAILLSSAACRELPFPPSTSVPQTKPNQTKHQLSSSHPQ